MSNTIDKYIILTFSIVNHPFLCHPYMFITETYSSKLTIMYFWAPTPKTPAKNGSSKKSLETSLKLSMIFFEIKINLSPSQVALYINVFQSSGTLKWGICEAWGLQLLKKETPTLVLSCE